MLFPFGKGNYIYRNRIVQLETVGQIHIIGAFYVFDGFFLNNLSIQIKGIYSSVRLFIGSKDNAFGDIIGVHPNGGVIGVVRGCFGNHIGRYGRQFTSLLTGNHG